MLVTCADSEALGEAVEAWRQRDGVKNEDGVDVGVLDWRSGTQEGTRRVVFHANCGVATTALDDKLRRADKRTSKWEGLRAHEKMTLASPLGIAAGRSPSCAVPPIMTLMTAEQEFWKSEFGLRSGIRCSQALARELLRVPLSQPQSMCPCYPLSCAWLLIAPFSAGDLPARQCSRCHDRCIELPARLILQCRDPRSQDKRRRKSRSGHGTGAGQLLSQAVDRMTLRCSLSLTASRPCKGRKVKWSVQQLLP